MYADGSIVSVGTNTFLRITVGSMDDEDITNMSGTWASWLVLPLDGIAGYVWFKYGM